MPQEGIVLRASVQLTGVPLSEKLLMFRTKDIYLTAFLISRGFQWFAMEEIEVNQIAKNRFDKSIHKKNKFIFFYFKEAEKIKNMSINYFNGTSLNLNVNASIFVQNILQVRSIITDPPF